MARLVEFLTAKVRVSGPRTALFTGLTRPEAIGASMIAAGERGAFEGLSASSNWRIDMSMEENAVVPGTLSDLSMRFLDWNLSGGVSGTGVVPSLGATRSSPFIRTKWRRFYCGGHACKNGDQRFLLLR